MGLGLAPRSSALSSILRAAAGIVNVTRDGLNPRLFLNYSTTKRERDFLKLLGLWKGHLVYDTPERGASMLKGYWDPKTGGLSRKRGSKLIFVSLPLFLAKVARTAAAGLGNRGMHPRRKELSVLARKFLIEWLEQHLPSEFGVRVQPLLDSEAMRSQAQT